MLRNHMEWCDGSFLESHGMVWVGELVAFLLAHHGDQRTFLSDFASQLARVA